MAGISTASGFSLRSRNPLDDRNQFTTLAEMKNFAESSLYDGLISYNLETKKTYQFSGDNEVDEELGRWRELVTASSSGTGAAAEIKVSEERGNALVMRKDGLYVATPEQQATGNLDEDIETPLLDVPTIPVNGMRIPLSDSYKKYNKLVINYGKTIVDYSAPVDYTQKVTAEMQNMSSLAINKDTYGVVFDASKTQGIKLPKMDYTYPVTYQFALKGDFSTDWIAFMDANASIAFGPYTDTKGKKVICVDSSPSGTLKGPICLLPSNFDSSVPHICTITVTAQHKFNCYIDGVLLEKVEEANGWGNYGEACLGRRIGGGNPYPFNGEIYFLKVYNKTLDDTAVVEQAKILRAYLDNHDSTVLDQSEILRDYDFIRMGKGLYDKVDTVVEKANYTIYTSDIDGTYSLTTDGSKMNFSFPDPQQLLINKVTEKDNSFGLAITSINGYVFASNNTKIISISDDPIGTIRDMLMNNEYAAAGGFIPMDGSGVEIGKYPDFEDYLVKTFGKVNYYGGDGRSTYQLPLAEDSQGKYRFIKAIQTLSKYAGTEIQVSDEPVGTIHDTLGDVPVGFVPMDGREVALGTYPEFEVYLGDVFGDVYYFGGKDGKYKMPIDMKVEGGQHMDITMTSNDEPAPYKVTASGVAASRVGRNECEPYELFTNRSTNNGTYDWASEIVKDVENAKFWVMIDLGRVTPISGITLKQNGFNGNPQSMKAFILQGSNDGVNFDTLLEKDNLKWSEALEEQTFLLPDGITAKYKYYKLAGIQPNGYTPYDQGYVVVLNRWDFLTAPQYRNIRVKSFSSNLLGGNANIKQFTYEGVTSGNKYVISEGIPEDDTVIAQAYKYVAGEQNVGQDLAVFNASGAKDCIYNPDQIVMDSDAHVKTEFDLEFTKNGELWESQEVDLESFEGEVLVLKNKDSIINLMSKVDGKDRYTTTFGGPVNPYTMSPWAIDIGPKDNDPTSSQYQNAGNFQGQSSSFSYWAIADFGEPIAVTHIGTLCFFKDRTDTIRANGLIENPGASFEGSLDGNSWTTIIPSCDKNYIDPTLSKQMEYPIFKCPNTATYRYYKFKMSNTMSTNGAIFLQDVTSLYQYNIFDTNKKYYILDSKSEKWASSDNFHSELGSSLNEIIEHLSDLPIQQFKLAAKASAVPSGKIQSYHSASNMFLTPSVSTKFADNYDFFQAAAGETVSENASVRMAVQTDDKDWYIYDAAAASFVKLGLDIPTVAYNKQTGSQRDEWEAAEARIAAGGITIEQLKSLDFNLLAPFSSIRFAIVLSISSVDDKCTLSKLNWQYDSKGDMVQMQPSEYEFKTNNGLATFTSKLTNSKIKLNILV